MDLSLEEHVIAIGGRRWSIQAVRDHDALLSESEHFENPPYGLLLWESAIALAGLVGARGTATFAGRTVLELGCGVGLPGLVAASLGATVVQADHEPRALDLARQNARRNGIPAPRQLSSDWRTWGQEQRFDIILGADIAYETVMHEHLRRIFTRNLAVGGLLLLADPGRQQTLELLAALDAVDGFEIALDTVLVPDVGGPERRPVDVTLVSATRR